MLMFIFKRFIRLHKYKYACHCNDVLKEFFIITPESDPKGSARIFACLMLFLFLYAG
jgi:hypothetical protein